jgi:hypothetical protein
MYLRADKMEKNYKNQETKADMKTYLFDSKMIIIKSFYLVLGSVSLYIFLNELKLFFIYSEFGWSNDFVQLTKISIVFSLISGVLLVFAYYGFIFQKRHFYPRFVGVFGCSIFLVYMAYEMYNMRAGGYFEWGRDASYILPQFILLIISIILIVATMFFWKRLGEVSSNLE